MTEQMWFDAIGMIGFGTNVVGNLLLTGRTRSGWIVRMVSNLFWVAYAVTVWSPPVLANGVTFLLINVVGWWRWRPTCLCMRNDNGIIMFSLGCRTHDC